MINCIKKLHCNIFLHLYNKLIHLTSSYYIVKKQNIMKKLNILPREYKIKSPTRKYCNILPCFGTNFALLSMRIK